jgi:hypothetical protein
MSDAVMAPHKKSAVAATVEINNALVILRSLRDTFGRSEQGRSLAIAVTELENAQAVVERRLEEAGL